MELILVIIYLIVTLFIGIYTSKNVKSLSDYILARRNFSLPVLTATVAATLIGSSHTIGFVSKIYSTGIIYPIAASTGLLTYVIFIKFIAPRIIRFAGKYSIAEAMEEMYGKNGRIITGFIACIHCFGVLAAQILAISFMFENLTEYSPLACTMISVILVVGYSAFGGIRSVVITDIFQFLVLIVVLPLISNIIIEFVGGTNRILENIPKEKLVIFEINNFWNYVALFVSFAIPLMHAPCAQRYFMCKEVKDLKIISLTTLIIDAILIVLVTGVAFAAIVKLPGLPPGQVFTEMIKTTLPSFLQGLAIIGILAVAMSSADSFLNTAGILFIHDFIGGFTKLKDNTKLVLMKIFTFISGFVVMYITLKFRSIFEIMLYFAAFYSSTISIPFLLGLFIDKPPKEAFYTAAIASSITFIILDNCIGDEYRYVVYLTTKLVSIFSYIAVYNIEKKRSIGVQYLQNLVEKITNLRVLPYVKALASYFNIKSLMSYSAVKVENYGAEYAKFGGFLCICYLIPFYLFDFTHNKYFAMLTILKLFCGVLGFILLFYMSILPKYRKIFPLYWHFTLMFCLPFASSLIYLVENGEGWMMNMVLSIFILTILVDWKEFLIIMVIGFLASFMVYYLLLGGEALNISNIYMNIYTMIFSSAVGLLFIRKKSKDHDAKLQSARAISGAIAHDLRPILSIIKIQTNKIGQEDMAHENIVVVRNTIVAAVSKGDIFISSMLNNLKGINSDNAEKFSVVDCVDKVVTHYIVDEQKKQSINVEIKNDFYIIADENQIIHVILNLLNNALYYIGGIKDGEVLVTAEVIGDKEKILTVKDNGPGIDEKAIDKIFQPFYSKRKHGTGIGLTFCKKAIENLGGSITCKSVKGKYTKFIISFP